MVTIHYGGYNTFDNTIASRIEAMHSTKLSDSITDGAFHLEREIGVFRGLEI